MVCNAGKTVTIYDVPKLAAFAIPQAFKQQSIQKGFEKSGIWPFNSNIFTGDDFLCSSITDRYLPGTENISTIQSTPINRVPSELSTGDIQSGSGSENLNIMGVSSPSQLESFTREHIEEVAETITPESVRPYPKAGPRLSSMKRKKGKTRILTDTPEIRLIEIAEQEKQRKNKAKEERQFKKNLKNTEKKNPKLPVELTSKRAVEKEMISSDSDMENVFIAASSEGSFVIETSEEMRRR